MLNTHVHMNSQFYRIWSSIDLAPASIAKEINEFNEWLSPHINFLAYDIGLVTEKNIYEKDLAQFYKDLDTAEDKLKIMFNFLKKKSTDLTIKKKFWKKILFIQWTIDWMWC